ncbi:MAG: hypothetical protein AAFW73_27295, partial [Bacteroidota bacterium]
AQGGPLPNLVLPKTEVLSWYCVRIYHRARVGQIRFLYNSFGQFDFNAVYNQPGFLRTLQRKWERGQLSTRPIRSAAREIILTEVRSGRERLVLEYESIPTTGALNLPDFRAKVR